MIKYIEYDSIDETGRHIIPVNTLYHMNKTASGEYSPEIMKVILNMKRVPELYYVVINALGSAEIWGSNRNGDAFPASGLSHRSLRTDMGTPNDYGYKTFEYYAHLYRHHVNKDPNNSFGEIVFSHWNPAIQRVELIVGVNKVSASDIIDDLENGRLVSVSMGARVKFDRCSICGNQATTRATYCNHLKNYMNQIVDRELADKWSKELSRPILPGAQVFAYNDYPRFFDISKVYVGADRTAYILGKAASAHITYSADIAEALKVTDSQIDKLAQVGKEGEIEKDVGGALGPDDIDGQVNKTDRVTVIQKALNEKVKNSIAAEPMLPSNLLDSISTLPLDTIFSTMLGMGIFPKPAEAQRIIIVKIGLKDEADELDDQHQIFDYTDNSSPYEMNISNDNFNDTLGKALIPYLASRSCLPTFLEPRLGSSITKTGFYSSTEGKDYWLESGPQSGPFMEQSTISPAMKALGGLAAIYAGLKLKALGYGPKQIVDIFMNKPWLRSMVGGGVMWQIYNNINKASISDSMLRPASDYANVLQDTNFSGHLKAASLSNAVGLGALAGAIMLPSTYMINAANQRSLYNKGKELFPGAGTSPKKAAIAGGAAVGGGTLLYDRVGPKIKKGLSKILPHLK